MTSNQSVILEVDDPAATGVFHRAGFGLGPPVSLRASEAPTTSFRGFENLGVSQPDTVDGLISTGFDAGAIPLKSATKSLWGVCSDGSGCHRIAIVGDTGPFTDPDGFVWEARRGPIGTGRLRDRGDPDRPEPHPPTAPSPVRCPPTNPDSMRGFR